MAENRRCPQCGEELPADAPMGLCPQCVLNLGVATEQATRSPTVAEAPLTEGPGTLVGRYKLLQQIGEGGMGLVFMAEQTEPVRRRVALKIIKLGMDTRQVVARFEAERQALALMDHPNIARVLDAGSTETGRPYFVMELVRGVPITEYCDRNRLSTRERLKLFMDICRAVQHAHQKGIIHRDIKPSNVMVTLHDGQPVPKVIDFGVAKATNQRLTEKTLFTGYAQMIGTPVYMSPEQAEMSGLDVDTRSDIYSLGVLLYELLTSTTPFEEQRLRSAGYDEMRRIISEEEAPRPSVRLSSLKATLTCVAEHRGTDPVGLGRLIRGDLDRIVMKALEKDRTRRYETPGNLAEDLRRYLADEPVTARRASAGYYLRKFAKRNKVLFGGIAAVFGALVLGIVGTSTGLLQAGRARGLAERAQVLAERRQKESEAARQQEARQRQRAVEQERIATRQRKEAERSLYFAHMVLARQDWENGDVGRLWEFLDAHRPKPGQQDFRGWEWYYLQALLHRDLHTLSGHLGAVRSVAWSPDGRYLASASDDHTLRVWDAAEGKAIHVLRGHTAEVRSVAWSPDGRRLASASDDETIKVWDWAAEAVVLMLSGHRGWISCVTWSPDGTQLASAGEDSAVRIWDASTGQPSMSLACKARPEAILSVTWSPDGQWLATGHARVSDGHDRLTVWNLATGRHRHLDAQSGDGAVRSVAWSPDSRSVASATSHLRVKVWDGATGQRQFVLRDHKSEVNSVCWSPDGQRLASVGSDQTLKIWDAATRKVLVTLCGHTAGVLCVAWSLDGRQLATGSEDGTLKIWDPAQAAEALTTCRHANWVSAVSWSPDGRRLATAHLLSKVGVWDPVTGEELLTLEGHTERVWHVAWSPEGKRLATASMDGTVKIWDAAGAPAIQTLRGHQTQVLSVAWSPHGHRVASSGEESTIVWDATTGEAIFTLAGGSVAWSPDGLRLALRGNHGEVIVCDATGGEKLRVLRSRTPQVRSVAWSPDGRHLAAGCADGTIQVWEVASGREVFSVRGHTAEVPSIAWSPDGRRLASGAMDGTIKVRDTLTGEETLVLRAHEGQIFSVAWSSDGRRLASGSFDNTAKVWDASIGYELEGRFGSEPVRFHLVRQWVRRIAGADPKERREILADMRAHLAARAERGLAPQDAALAITMVQSLERAGDRELAVEACRSFAEPIARCKDEELRRHAAVLEGTARRLGLPGKEMLLKGARMDGAPLDWPAYRGKVVLIDFWSSASGRCRAELAGIRNNHELYHGRGFDVVGISLDRDRAALMGFLDSQRLPWAILHEKGAQGTHPVATYYGVVDVPTALLVDKEGKVVSLRACGPELHRLLEQLIGPPYLPKGKLTCIDLQAQANQKLVEAFHSEQPGNDLAELPTGQQTFAGVKFTIGEGVLQLAGSRLRDMPKAIEGIQVNEKFVKLYVLQGTGWEGPDGTVIGQYKVHYEDGAVEEVPIVCGENLRGWWGDPQPKGVTRGRIAWVGTNAAARRAGKTLRLYLTAWENPHPDRKVLRIDYVSADAAPFCVAMTIEHAEGGTSK